MRILKTLLISALAAALCLGVVGAAAMGDDPVEDDEPGLGAIREQIEAGEAGAAVEELLRRLEDKENDADVHNLLGYGYRHLEDFQRSREHYDRALAINPEHLGALEYLGELELQLGNKTAAERHLQALEKLCPQTCEELEELREAIAAAVD